MYNLKEFKFNKGCIGKMFLRRKNEDYNVKKQKNVFIH